ncbi:OmpA family protein [Pseudogemmobacter sonorensis]|uniref:OmpA family protein n=1 Tax=Pseudogemmobacter sonorensis TaxID=2989681 RepID=UPI0036926504
MAPIQTRALSRLLATGCILALAACGPDFDRESGAALDEGRFGNPTMHNTLLHNGELDYTQILAERFNKEVNDTITFPFDSAQLTPEARAVLDAQANFIRQFPEVRFKVYGHTDLVGSQGYNHALGLRRARAVVDYFASKGISKSRLEAVVSYGKTRPVIQTAQPEERNRRTVTEVTGFVKGAPMVMNGKYAEIVWRTYTTSLAERPHPLNSVMETQVNPGGN